MHKIATISGYAQAGALAIYAIWLAISGVRNHTTLGQPVILGAIFIILSVFMYLVARGVHAGQGWSRTPFFMIQIFAIIAGYTFIKGTDVSYKTTGVILVLDAVVAYVCLVRTPFKD